MILKWVSMVYNIMRENNIINKILNKNINNII